jgi:hypothetical protein
MTIQAPTRITIEIHPPDPSAGSLLESGMSSMPTVRIVPEDARVPGVPSRSVFAGEPREDLPMPAAYQPGPCRCLDDDDCAADHANE